MKKFFVSLLLLFLAGCGSNYNENVVSSDNDLEGNYSEDTISVKIIGNIYNSPASNSSSIIGSGSVEIVMAFPEMPMQPVIVPQEELNADLIMALITEGPERMADVSQGEFIMVSTTITNDGDVALHNLSYVDEIEDAAFLTPEEWNCIKWFNYLDGSGASGKGVWQIQGSTLNDPQPTPVLPACEGDIQDPAFICEESLQPLDCDDPHYEITYFPPGDGFCKGSGNIPSLAVGETFSVTTGYAHSDIDIRPDHIARWIVYDSEGAIIKRKEYRFNVIP